MKRPAIGVVSTAEIQPQPDALDAAAALACPEVMSHMLGLGPPPRRKASVFLALHALMEQRLDKLTLAASMVVKAKLALRKQQWAKTSRMIRCADGLSEIETGAFLEMLRRAKREMKEKEGGNDGAGTG